MIIFYKKKTVKNFICVFCLPFLFCLSGAYAQSTPAQPVTPAGQQRILFTSITPSINTGMDYSPWMNDDLTQFVQNAWQGNSVWVDISLKLTQHSKISEFEFYDGEGVFTDQPDSIYAVNGTIKTFLGTFTGPGYLVFQDLKLTAPVEADAILIHKFGNNVPQKVYIYGVPVLSSNALLANIGLSSGTALIPAFSPSTTSYTTAVSNTTTSIKLTPTASSTAAAITVNSTAVTSGTATASLALATGANVINTTVKAADGKTTTTYSVTVNRTASSTATTTDSTPIVKIPIDSTRWFILNNLSGAGLGALTDGNLAQQVNLGYGMMMNNFDSYYPVKPGEQIDLYQIKFYSYEGGQADNPLTVSVIDSTGTRTTVGTFVGGVYMSWLGPYPGQSTFNLNTPMKNIKYVVLNSGNVLPAEMELYGHYKTASTVATAAAVATTKKTYPLNQYFGVNAFEWNFEDPTNPSVVSPTLLAAAKSFTQVRHYMDWSKLETTQGMYTYNPVHSGGWNYDALYQACKANNMLVLADLKTLPAWLVATYPTDQQDPENVPVPYGSDFSNPNSYILQAKVAFQYAARYGSTGTVAPSLLSVDTTIRWTADPQNKVLEGTALVKYIECDNERDKWWKGRKAYQTAFEYAANLSAFYDGNKNTMGPGVGVKNADPNMQVVMGGLASADPTYLHGMIEWCRLHRGYKADGTVNLCWDVINYHLYANNYNGQGSPTSGVSPEAGNTAQVARGFMSVAHEYANDMPVWVTESGYDINQGSSQKAPAIGNKTAARVQADWVLRTSLLYAREGIQRVFYYEEYDDNAANPTQYASSGLINDDKSRRPAADYLYQVNKLLGAYSYKQTSSTGPMVDQYQSGSSLAYVLYLPTQTGQTANYTLNLGTADSAYVYTPTIGAASMSFTKVKLSGGNLSVAISETPVFVIPSGVAASKTMALNIKTDSIPPNTAFDKSIVLYPNPSTTHVTVALNNDTTGDVTINILDTRTGKLYATSASPKNADNFEKTIDISKVPMGVYAVQVIQGSTQTVRKAIKIF